jgi:glycosyltransferase involved in cell wall biosynthesis
MHFVGLVDHPQHVCARYRLAALQPYLARWGHGLELRAIPRGLWQRHRLWSELGAADGVVLQRRLLSSWHLFWVRRMARRLVFDFDDAVFQRDSYAGKAAESVVRRRRFIRTLHAADLVIAGNAFLAEEARRYVPAERIALLPTCIAPEAYPLARHAAPANHIRLVWIGSSSTLQGLEQSSVIWNTVGQALPGVRFRIICDRFPEFEGLPVEAIAWAESSEAEHLAAADIGVSWLPDDAWSRGKCGLKVLQYMAAGLPVVANPVGVTTELVRDGVTGFLARTPSDWVQAVRRLAEHPELRRSMGAAGRRRVEREFSVAVHADRWVKAVIPRSLARAA